MAEESDEDRQWRERRAREKEARPDEEEARPVEEARPDATEVPLWRRDKAIPLGKDPAILCWLAIIGVVLVVAVIVYSAVTYPLDSSQPLTVTIENKNPYEITVFVYVDGEYLGGSYIDGGEEKWFRLGKFDYLESHQLEVRSTALLSDLVLTTEAGNHVDITIHQDGRATYFFW